MIKFAIPATDPGCASNTVNGQSVTVCTFTSGTSALLTLGASHVTIDGFTQAGAKPNSLSAGNNAILTVALKDATAQHDYALVIGGNYDTVEGLSAVNWYIPVYIYGSHDTVTDNFLGLTPSGAADGNTAGVAVVTTPGMPAAAHNVIRGNVLSGNGYGAYFGGDASTTISGNIIGGSPDGNSVLGNVTGIYNGASVSDEIGGTTAAARNFIGGNSDFGIQLTDGHGNKIQGNTLGLGVGGGFLPNYGSAIELYTNGNGGETSDLIGGTRSGQGNIIAYSSVDGVLIGGGAVLAHRGCSSPRCRGNCRLLAR